ncbi:uncharacterized protein LOC113344250 isoform X2 [Papaver somniferum]|uniref:uncharacterized protein LOC113344250 isoform X2 n=1 Tax=Papaver somniferum TaxID=3469 RepID=UPI000E700755|nr:uncharacterized protein LOC113344250 isoform X2 [Papaver somniferum]
MVDPVQNAKCDNMEIQLCQRIITGDSVKMSYTAGVTMVSRTLWVVKMPSVLISLQRKNQRFGMPSSLQLCRKMWFTEINLLQRTLRSWRSTLHVKVYLQKPPWIQSFP